MLTHWIVVAQLALSQSSVEDLVEKLFRRAALVEQESGEAKKARLDFIGKELQRIRGEKARYEKEYQEAAGVLPDPVAPRVIPKLERQRRDVDRRNFNQWASLNDPKMRDAVFRGQILNNLVRILGPIAATRKDRRSKGNEEHFPSLGKDGFVSPDMASRIRYAKPNSTSTDVTHRLNRPPLDFQWPTVMYTSFPSDIKLIAELRTAFLESLSNAEAELGGPVKAKPRFIELGEELEETLRLTTAKVAKERANLPSRSEIDVRTSREQHGDLREVERLLEQYRVTTRRLIAVPSEYKVTRFDGGTIEDYLEFVYSSGMIIKEATKTDEDAYWDLFRKLQDYARDVQYVEDWKAELDRRWDRLSAEERALLWKGATDAAEYLK